MADKPRLVNPGPIVAGVVLWVLATGYAWACYDMVVGLAGKTLPASTAAVRVIAVEVAVIAALFCAVIGTGFVWLGWTWTRHEDEDDK